MANSETWDPHKFLGEFWKKGTFNKKYKTIHRIIISCFFFYLYGLEVQDGWERIKCDREKDAKKPLAHRGY